MSEHASHLALIVTDNETVAEYDRERIGVYTERWRYLPACQPCNLTATEAAARVAVRHGRALWASRLDPEKRPELLSRVATQLWQLAPDLHLDVFGSAVLGAFNPDCLAGLPNLCYRGHFDGFTSIDVRAYDAFVYTTACDGMPNVILEAAAAGLPIIAPDIGGIGEFIIDGESGLLLAPSTEDEEMAAAYARAITRLANNPSLRGKLVGRALELLEQRHGLDAFRANARVIFDSPSTGAPWRHLYHPVSAPGTMNEETAGDANRPEG